MRQPSECPPARRADHEHVGACGERQLLQSVSSGLALHRAKLDGDVGWQYRPRFTEDGLGILPYEASVIAVGDPVGSGVERDPGE